MSYPIIVTKDNLIPNSKNTFEYKFSNFLDTQNVEIALASCNLFFSWQNITAAKNNNKFRIIHPTSGGTVNIDITLPDGGYQISDISNYITYKLISLGYYIQNNTTGEQITYINMKVNPTSYSVDINCFAMPTSLPSGYTAGSSITFPATAKAPQFVVLDDNFGNVIGQNIGTYPSSPSSVNTTISSSKTPQVSNVTSVILTCDAAFNLFAPNSKVLHSLSSSGYNYGQLIKSEPSFISWTPLMPGNRNSLVFQFCDQNLQPLNLIDTDLVIKLFIRFKND